MSDHARDAEGLRAELHRLLDGLDAERLPAVAALLTVEAERQADDIDRALATLAELPGGLPPAEVEKARAVLRTDTRRRAS